MAGGRLFLGNLSYRTTEDSLRELLGEVGAVLSVHLPVDRVTGRPRGFAFVEMASPGEATRAIDRLNGRVFLGRNLVVAPARLPPPPERAGPGRRPPPGGPRRGRP